MNVFNIEYRKMLADVVVCPRCKATNVPNASPTIEIDETGLKAACNQCSFARPIEAFLPREK